jgi:opacity protein-like surface antigen
MRREPQSAQATLSQRKSRCRAVALFLHPRLIGGRRGVDPHTRRPSMRRAIGVLALGALSALPVTAHASSLDVRAGGFFPQLDSNLFHDDFALYNVHKNDFDGFTAGIEFSTKIARNLELGFHFDGYSKSVDTSYRNYTRADGSEIQQTLHLHSYPLGVSLRIIPTGRNVKVAPYLAIGADAVFWHYEEFGDFIDFFDPTNPIISDDFINDGVAPGIHVAGGLRVAVSPDFSLVAEGRYLKTPKVDMHGVFAQTSPPNEIDLSGWSATFGLHIRF